MSTAAEPPYVIYQQMAANYQFTKSPPTTDPKRNGVIWKYELRTVGGYFRFSDRFFFQVRRIVANFADADSWSIGIRHSVSDSIETLLTSETQATKQEVDFLITGASDGDYEITINGTSYSVSASGLTVDQIASQLQLLVDDDVAVVAVVGGTTPDTVTVSSVSTGAAFTYSSSSTGDPITETVLTEDSGGLPEFRLDVIRELAPGDAIVVETSGATQAMSVEVLAFLTSSINPLR